MSEQSPIINSCITLLMTEIIESREKSMEVGKKLIPLIALLMWSAPSERRIKGIEALFADVKDLVGRCNYSEAAMKD